MHTIELAFATAGGVLLTALLAFALLRTTSGAALAPVDRAEKVREVAGNFVWSILFVTGIAKFAGHAGWLSATAREMLFGIIIVPLLISAVVYVKAMIDMKRLSASKA